MATKKKKSTRRRKKGGRKLEFAIYIAGVLVVCLVGLGIVKGIQAIVGVGSNDTSSVPANGVVSGDGSVGDDGTAVSSTADGQTASQSGESASQSGETSSQATSSVASSSNSGNANKDYITYTKSGKEELDEWYLFLVNPWNTIDSDWIADMTYIDSEYQLDSRIVPAYKDMVSAAAADGVNLYAISCYRSYSTQQRLYNNRVVRAKNDNPSFTQKEAEDYAATYVARPGTSEHQTGLAIDFNSVETDFGSTKAGKWLKEHAHEYGFILRYEADKQDKTGVTWEPWHYRFVGVKHATKIKQMGCCLEEYIEYIKANG